jgi:hypothetical protein
MTELSSELPGKSSPATSKFAPLAIVILAYSASLACMASVLLRQRGFPLDDSYIHQTVARNFARYGVLGFIPGVPSSGATSGLWATIQAANYKFTHIDPIIFNLLLSWAALAIIGTTLFQLAGKDGLPVPKRIAFAVAPACSGNFMWLSLIGMEHLLFVALALGCIIFWSDKRKSRGSLPAGICAGLLCLARPEAIVFGPLMAIVAWKEKRQVRDFIALLIPWIAGMAILVSVDLYTSHSLLPATLKGRSWLYFNATNGPHSLQSIARFWLGWTTILHFQFSVWHEGIRFNLLRVLIPLTLAIIGAIRLAIQAAPRIHLLLLFAAVHFCVFLSQFPVPGNGGRYQPLNLLLLFPCMFFGLGYLIEKMTGHARVAAAISLVALMAAGTASLRSWRLVSLVSIAHIANTHGAAAQWLLHNTPVDTKVAAFDIGRISYDLDRPIIDLGGLVDPSYFAYLENHRVRAYLSQQHADYLVSPSGGFEPFLGFPNSSRPQLAKLAEFCSPHEAWNIGWIPTGHAEQCQIVYKIPAGP